MLTRATQLCHKVTVLLEIFHADSTATGALPVLNLLRSAQPTDVVLHARHFLRHITAEDTFVAEAGEDDPYKYQNEIGSDTYKAGEDDPEKDLGCPDEIFHVF